MPQGLIIFIVIVVLSSVIGAVTQWLKAQQQAEQERLAQSRASARSGKTENTIDKYVEEIERLRKRPQESGSSSIPKARPLAKKAEPAKVEPVKKQRVAGEATFTTMAAPTVRAVPTSVVQNPPPLPVVTPLPIAMSGIPIVTPVKKLEDLPVAPLIFKAPVAAVTPPTPLSGVRVTSTPQNKTEFAQTLTKMLASPQSLPLAFVLQEILSKPKSRRE